jgi:DNA (cytosine-5)-methyltransferase 1
VRLTRRPYLIENVRGAPLRGAVLLCGAMFDLRVYRHRLFESNVLLMVPPHPRHRESTGAHRGYSYRHPFVCVAGHNFHLAEGKAAMGITWMGTRRELSQAVPPAYTHHLGLQLRRYLEDTPDA